VNKLMVPLRVDWIILVNLLESFLCGLDANGCSLKENFSDCPSEDGFSGDLHSHHVLSCFHYILRGWKATRKSQVVEIEDGRTVENI